MIRKEECMDIVRLWRQGYSQRQIARKLGIHRKTVAKYLRSQELPVYHTVSRAAILKPYEGMIADWLRQEDYHATRIHELVTAQGYHGSYETVKNYVRSIKVERDRQAYIRFETMPGQQAQVDFAEFCAVHENGAEITLYCFIMVLGFSRHMYVEFVRQCTMPVFLDCHMRAFGYFRGVPG